MLGSPFWQEVEERLRLLAAEISEYAAAVKAFCKACGKLPDKVAEKLSGSLVDLRGIQGRLEAVRESLIFFVSSDEKFCHWFEVKKSGKSMAVKLSPRPLKWRNR